LTGGPKVVIAHDGVSFSIHSQQSAQRRTQRKKFLSTLVTILTLLCQGSGRGVAEVRLSGTQDRVVLETNNAPIDEIVAALRTAFGIEVTLAGTTLRKFTGTYSGPVRQIFSRLFAGEDYIFHTTSDGVIIVLLGHDAPDTAARAALRPYSSSPPSAPFNLALPPARSPTKYLK
jgi:uncharacterized membrane protein YqgA involved in biofilm formation